MSEIIESTKWWSDKKERKRGRERKRGDWPRGDGTRRNGAPVRSLAHLSGSKDVYSAVCAATITIIPKERTTLIDLWLGRYRRS